MQNHTGEHIVSGIAHRLFGVNNVGFHLGEELVTIDFDKELTREQLDEIELFANQKVWQNLPVRAYFPNDSELKATNYRSKKELGGITGDTAGYFVLLCECSMLVAAAVINVVCM